MPLYSAVRARISIPWLFFALLLLPSGYFLVGRGMILDDVQALLFFPLLLALWKIPRDRRLRLPAPLVLAAGVLAASASLSVRGIGSHSGVSAHAVLARPEHAVDALESRKFYRRYNQIAEAYQLPPMELVHRTFGSDAAAESWLAAHQGVALLMRGGPEWYRVVLSTSAEPYFRPFESIGQSTELPAQAGTVSFDGGASLAIVFQPEVFSIANEPTELSRHFAAWLAQGLRHDLSLGAAAALSLRRDAFEEASRITGLWKSHVPLGVAHYFLGTLSLIEAVEQRGEDEALLASALSSFKTAAGYLEKQSAPEAFAAAFNNAAVALVLKSNDPRDLRKAKRWLLYALEAVTKRPSAGAQAALYNIRVLDELGGSAPAAREDERRGR